jgi:endothelin-converting enzyme/putative endopeptidase
MRNFLIVFGLLAVAVGCGRSQSPESERPIGVAKQAEQAAAARETTLVSGIALENMDHDVRPQDDFYRFVNGTWLANTEIPADRPGWGAAYEIHERNEKRLRTILEDAAAARAPEGSDAQIIGDFYASYMDTERVNELGITPLAEELAVIDAAATHADIVRLFGRLARMNIQHPFKYGTNRDLGDTSRNLGYLWQGGLGLPDRDYYLEDEEKFTDIRTAYADYMETMLTLAGYDGGGASAMALLEFETQMAEVSWPAEKLRDLNAIYNLMNREQMAEMAPAFDWNAYLDAAGLGGQEEVVMETPSFFKGFGELVAATDVETLKNYLRFKLVDHFGYKLSDPFFEARFAFALGKAYLERHFPLEAKARTEEMVANLKAVMAESIDNLEWMGDATKEEAKKKLAALRVYVGYPGQWRDYDGLRIVRDDLMGNMIRMERFEHDRAIAQLSEPPIDGEFAIPTQSVNAYYSQDAGELVFLAGYLQPPMFDMTADDAMNYGALGSTIGHEISHAFDDKGRTIDEKGELRDWWTEEDAEKFKARAGLLVEQYNQYEPLPGLFVNGELTLGENIADLAGLAIAYRAYTRSLDGEEPPVIDGYTGEQRFFMANAQSSRGMWRDGLLREIVMSDPHSPDEYRVNGVVKNMPEFYAAFDVKEGDGLYLPEEERVHIW